MAKTKQLGKVEPELNERITKYSKLIGMAKTDLIEELFNKETEGKVLDNSFIYPEEVYYFNFLELMEEKETIATKDRPKGKFIKFVHLVKKIPNNLDSFNKDFRTFCYNKPEEHLGIYSYNKIDVELNVKQTQVFQYYILFEYNEATEELILRLINFEDISLVTDSADLEDVYKDLTTTNKEYAEINDIIEELPEDSSIKDFYSYRNEEGIAIVLSLVLDSILVIQSLENAKSLSFAMLKDNPEVYNEIKGKYNSKDLVLFRNIEVVKDSAEEDPEGAVKNG